MQESAMTALSSAISIASTGQQSTQAAQPVQVSFSTTAGMFRTPWASYEKSETVFCRGCRWEIGACNTPQRPATR